jgi:hypothetical protein
MRDIQNVSKSKKKKKNMLIKVNNGIVAQSILKGIQPTIIIMSTISIYKLKNGEKKMVKYWRKPILFYFFLFLIPLVALPFTFSISFHYFFLSPCSFSLSDLGVYKPLSLYPFQSFFNCHPFEQCLNETMISNEYETIIKLFDIC